MNVSKATLSRGGGIDLEGCQRRAEGKGSLDLCKSLKTIKIGLHN